MEISEEKKLEILLSQLQERYEALHKMRDRSMQFVLWILGLGLGMAWLLINDTALKLQQKFPITVLLLIMGLVTLIFIKAIERGFKANKKIIIRIEKILKLYEKDYYGIDESILPTKFSCQKIGWTSHFKTLYTLLIVVFLFLIIITWSNPCKFKSIGSSSPQEPNQIKIQKNINK